jgi:hypothetical protein
MTSFLAALAISACVAWWSFTALIGSPGLERLTRQHHARAARALVPHTPASPRAGLHRRRPAHAGNTP